ELECLDLRRRCARALLGGRGVERHLQFGRNRGRNLVLHGEYIDELSVVSLGPEVIAVGDVGELRRDTKPVSCFAYAALEDCGDVQLLADDAQVVARAL